MKFSRPVLALFFASAVTTLSAQTFLNGQAADAVVGKPDLTTNSPTTASATNIGAAVGVAVDPISGQVFICDSTNNRILRFPSVEAATSGQPADIAFGQASLEASGNVGGVGAASLFFPIGIALDGAGRLWVADYSNNRVLRYDNATAIPPTVDTRTADGVLGQETFSGAGFGTAADQMYQPTGLWIEPNGSLWVADYSNNRVIRFNAAALLPNGADASIVLGQTDFVTQTSGATDSKMNRPSSCCVDAQGNLWVTDYFNNRVLRFDGASSFNSSGDAATAVLGQSDFSSAGSGNSASQFSAPSGAAIAPDGRLFVSDLSNNRVLWFDDPASIVKGAEADGVLGQSDFGLSDPGLSATRINRPQAVFVDESSRVWIPEYNNRRVIRFSPIQPPNPTPPAESAQPPVLNPRGKTKLNTARRRVVLKGSAADATIVQSKAGKGGFKKAKGSAANWKIPVRLTKNRTVIKVRATGPGGNSKTLKFIITRK